MSPQRKGLVSEADAARIARAVEIRALAELELVAAVLDAMKHGGSIREVGAASGLSERTILRWRKGQGLPSRDDWRRDAIERRKRLEEAYPELQRVYELLEQIKGE